METRDIRHFLSRRAFAIFRAKAAAIAVGVAAIEKEKLDVHEHI
jgi:hypothetical protein